MNLLLEHKVLFALLRAGLWERPLEDFSLFPLKVEQWDAVFRLAVQQAVTGLVFKGVALLPEKFFPSNKQLSRWMAYVVRIEQRNQAMNDTLGNLMELFRSKGLRPVLLKGQGIAELYETPWLRECGDIDLYFPNSKERVAAIKLLQGRTFMERHSDGSFCGQYQDFCIEVHPHLFDMLNPFHRRMMTKMEHNVGCETILLPRAGEVNVLAPIANLLMLNWHIMRHALGFGIGLRQCCDLARAYYRLFPACDKDMLCVLHHSLGLERWSRLLHSLLFVHLGLPINCLPAGFVPTRSKTLLEIVLRGGNFGLHVPEDTGEGRSSRTVLHNNRLLLPYLPLHSVMTMAHLTVRQLKK